METNDYTGERVRLCEDGKYRWTHPLDLLKNPSILFLIYKIGGIVLAIILAIIVIRTAIDGDWAYAWENSIKIILIVTAVLALVIYLGYLLGVGMYGRKFVVHFTLDEERLAYEQEPAQVERTRKFGWLAFLVGMLSDSPVTVGQGMSLAASSSSHTALLADVRRIKTCRAWGLIKANQRLISNRVYVPKEDFDLVLTYLRQHCPNAK